MVSLTIVSVSLELLYREFKQLLLSLWKLIDLKSLFQEWPGQDGEQYDYDKYIHTNQRVKTKTQKQPSS